MIVATEFLVAIRCPCCGKLDFHSISRFMFAGISLYKVMCSCGASKLIIGTKNRRQYWFQIPCVLCETNHLVYYKAKQLWSDEVSFLYCSDTNVELGFFGPDIKVRAVVNNYEHNLESLVDDLGYDDYFFNPEIMFEVLNSLHDIAEEGFLYCECGSYQIEIDVFPDGIELQCKDCKRISVVSADKEEDLNWIKGIKRIELVKNGFKSLDNQDKDKKAKKNSSKKSKH
jgi:hypothetical protein